MARGTRERRKIYHCYRCGKGVALFPSWAENNPEHVVCSACRTRKSARSTAARKQREDAEYIRLHNSRPPRRRRVRRGA